MTYVVEVGPRDGLQNESVVIPAATKIAFVDALSRAGLNEIEVTSFVSPRWVPQLADATEVLEGIQRRPGTIYSALIPNLKGLERALPSRPDKIAIFTAASETFNQKNVNTSIEGSFERLKPVVDRAHAEGLTVRGYVSTVFWCPYEGRVPVEKAVWVSERLIEMGCEWVALGDTIGKAAPSEVREVLDVLVKRIPPERVALHFHDTYGTARQNIQAAVEYGIDRFDASAGGLGGCPYAGPGAPGNVATEVVVEALREVGCQVDVDLDELRRARGLILDALTPRPGST